MWCVAHARTFPGRYGGGIHGGDFAGGESELMPENVSIALTRQVKVSVVGEIDDGFFICGGTVLDFERVAIRQHREDHLGGEISGIFFFSILAHITEFKSLSCRA